MLFYSLDLKPSFFSIRPYFGVKKEGFLELLSVFSEKNAVFYTKIAFFSLKCLQVPKVCVPLQPQSRNIDCEHKNAGAIAQLVEQRTEKASVKHLKQTYKTLNTRWLQKCDHLFLSLEIGRKYTGLHNLCKPNV